MLIDWDTALTAPPERDLWSLDPGDGSILGAYAALTGVTPRPLLLDLYRLRWDIADIAVDVEPAPGGRTPGAPKMTSRSGSELAGQRLARDGGPG